LKTKHQNNELLLLINILILPSKRN